MTTISEFVKVDITDQMKADATTIGKEVYDYDKLAGFEARHFIKEFGDYGSHSSFFGYLGEIIFSYYRHGNWNNVINKPRDQPNPFDDTIDGKTIEIKTGNRRVDIAKIGNNFYFMVAAHQIHHRPDYYVQILVHNGSAYITGYITLEEVLRVGVTGNGQINPSFNVPISKLLPIGSLINPIGLARWAK